MSILFQGRATGATAVKQSLWNRFVMFWVHHIRQAMTSLGEIWLTPASSLLTVAVLGVSLTLPVTLHLMVKNPLMVIKRWNKHPRFKRALVHYESTDDIKPVLEEIKALGKRVGLVLNPDTSIYDAEPYFDTVDLVMLMGVTPGFQGQKFIEKTIERIGKIKEINKKHGY